MMTHWKQDFPLLHEHLDLHYLDAAATTQRPQVVLDALRAFHTKRNANVHRGLYRLAEDATAAYEGARADVARFIGAEKLEEVVFTSGTTMGMNLLAQAWGRANLKRGDEIVTTGLEHHAVVVPWSELARELGVHVRVAPLAKNGSLDHAKLEALLSPRTRLVLLTALSNVTGEAPDIASIGSRAHRLGAKVFVDAAQAVAHMALDVAHMPIDALAFSGHKAYGDFGTGALYIRDTLAMEMTPFLRGGDMIRSVAWDRIEYLDAPQRFEAGTPNVAGAVALATGLAYIAHARENGAEKHERALTELLLHRLGNDPAIRVLGPTDAAKRGPLVSFTVDGVHPHDLAAILDRHSVAIRAGHHCAQPLHDALGIPASARASIGLWNEPEDIDALMIGIADARGLLGA